MKKNAVPFTKVLNYGALMLFVVAVVALCFSHRVPNSATVRAPASVPPQTK